MSEKLSDDELVLNLSKCPAVGQLFAHYKTGGYYRVVGSAIAEATQEPLVVYESTLTSITFARPLSEWRELVHYKGRAWQRFRAVEG